MGNIKLTGKKDRNSRQLRSLAIVIGIITGVGILFGILGGYKLGGGTAESVSLLDLYRSFRDPLFDAKKFWAGFMLAMLGSLFGDIYAYTRYEQYKNRRPDEEHGSAKLMAPGEMDRFNQQFFYDPAICVLYDKKRKTRRKKYTIYDKDNLKKICKSKRHSANAYKACFLNSQILGQDVYISMNTKFINRNLNTITIGGSGQGKSYSELFPNALNANANYIFTDPSGEIYAKVGKYLLSEGYELKVFNVDEFHLSMKYNPLAYIETEKDYNILVDALNKNIKPNKTQGGTNEFFDDAKDSLVCALIALLKELFPVIPIPEDASGEEREALVEANRKNARKQTLSNVMELLRMANQEMDEDGNQTSTLDEMFSKLRQVNRRSYAAKMWENFKVGGPKVCNEVIISAAAVFGRFFDTDDIAWLTMEDELHLEDLASDKKCALFLVIPQDTKTYNFMCSMVYSQLFSIATKAGKKWRDDHNLENPTLPRHLSFWLDEFANIGKIPSFMELLSVVRKYNISINIIIQGMAQLKSLYPKDEWEIIFANLDEMIYLGGMEPSTVKWLSEKLGKETIKSMSMGYSGRSGSLNMQNMARNLLTPDEIEQMSRAHELIFISGCKPIQTRKYDLSGHPNFDMCGEADPANNLNIHDRFKKNAIDYELLDQSLVTVDEIQGYNFDKLYLKEGYKRGQIAQSPVKSDSNGTDVIKQDKKLSADEKARKLKELKNKETNLDQMVDESFVARLDLTNAEIFEGFVPDHEFAGEDYDITADELDLDANANSKPSDDEDGGIRDIDMRKGSGLNPKAHPDVSFEIPF